MKLKGLFVMSSAFLLALATNVFAGDIGWYEGKTDASTYYISTADELKGLAELVNGDTDYGKVNFLGKNIVLQNDVSLADYANWTPIGNYSTEEAVFSGSFNGNHHSISNLNITEAGSSFNGLFGVISKGSVTDVKLKNTNINITRVSFKRDDTTPVIVGSIAGGIVQGSASYCENLSGTIKENCSVMTANDIIGGVFGYINGAGSTYNGNAANISAVNASIGGAVGYVAAGAVVENYNRGNIAVGENNQAGGITLACLSGNVVNSINSGNITGKSAFKSGTLLNLASNCALNSCIDFGDNDSVIYTDGIISKLVYNSDGSLKLEPGSSAKSENISSYDMSGDKIELAKYLSGATNNNLVRVAGESFAGFTWEIYYGSKVLCGDVNNDKTLNEKDLYAVMHGVNGTMLTAQELVIADFDGNGVLNILDAVRMLNDSSYAG